MEAFKCLLDEIDTAFRLGDYADGLHGLDVIEQSIEALAQEPDALLRLSRGLGALRVLHGKHEREGRTALAADAARWIAEVEQRVAELAQLAETGLQRRERLVQ